MAPIGKEHRWRLIYNPTTKAVLQLFESLGNVTHPPLGCEGVGYATLDEASKAITDMGLTVPDKDDLWKLLPAFATRTVLMRLDDVEAVLAIVPGNAPGELVSAINKAKKQPSIHVPASLVLQLDALLVGTTLPDPAQQARLDAAKAAAEAL